MNFLYEKSQYVSAPPQQYIITTQVPAQSFVYTPPNWCLQPTAYSSNARGFYQSPDLSGIQVNNLVALRPPCFRVERSGQYVSAPQTPKGVPTGGKYRNPTDKCRTQMITPRSTQTAMQLSADPNLQRKPSASFDSRSLLRRPDDSAGAILNYPDSRSVHHRKQTREVVMSATVARNDSILSDKASTPQGYAKFPETSAHKCVDEVAKQLDRCLYLGKSGFSTSSPKRQSRVAVVGALSLDDATSRLPITTVSPKLNMSEVRVLKRGEPLPTTVSELLTVTACRSLSRAEKRALRAKRNPRRKGRILTDAMKAQMLSRYRSLLAETTAPTTQRRNGLVSSKKKRVSRLKSGILHDRLVRCTPGHTELSCDSQVAFTKTQRKTWKLVLPSLPELEGRIEEILRQLAEFHDRAYKQTLNTPTKRKNTRRIVCGFHEVIKGLKLSRLKFLVIANDLEEGAYEIEDESEQQEGAVDSPKKSNALAKTLKRTVEMARERECPVVLAFKRRYLQKLCHKGAPVSCVGVISFAGTEDKAKELIERFNRAVNTFPK